MTHSIARLPLFAIVLSKQNHHVQDLSHISNYFEVLTTTLYCMLSVETTAVFLVETAYIVN